jgi:hypothetical protein
VPLIVVTPPPRRFTPDGRKRHRLEAIPEEEEPVKSQHPRLAELPSSSTSEDYDTPLTPQQLSQIDKEAEEFANLTFSIITQLLDVWPFHWQQQVDNQHWIRYRLTQEEREQLKFLGLQNLFNTSWLKPGLRHRGLGRWKKS